MDACIFEGTVVAIYSIHPFVMQCELDLVQDLEASLVRTKNCGSRACNLAVAVSLKDLGYVSGCVASLNARLLLSF